ncbi:Transforming growth factor-beta receptor-associated protein 1 [Exaiptasia diaphana]|nr:Transforming growth factor-beta receptor-associated protein 1 [Exaiptasia diaphana]
MSFKAFDLVQVLTKISTSSSDKPKTIECLDCAAQNLYIGTSDCYIFHYVFDDTTSPLGRTIFQCSLQTHKHINMKKPIQQVVTAPNINRLLVLCDGNILLFSMFELEFIVSDKLKGVNFIAKNDNPNNFDPFTVEVCISMSRKRVIQIVSVTENKIIPLKEIQLSEPPMIMKKPIQQVVTAPNINRLLVLCDGNILLFSMFELEGYPVMSPPSDVAP